MKKLLIIILLVFLLNIAVAFQRPIDHIFDGKMKYRIQRRTLSEKFSLVHGFISNEIVVCDGWTFTLGTQELLLVPITEDESVHDTHNLIHVFKRYPSGSWKIDGGIFSLSPLHATERNKK